MQLWKWLGITVMLLLLGTSGLAAELGPPQQVDVYPRGMDATWVLTAEPEMELLLPSSFDVNRIRYQTHDGAVVETLEAFSEVADGWIPPGLTELAEQMDELRSEIAELDAELAGVQQTLDYLRSGINPEQQDDPLEFVNRAQTLRVENEQRRQALEPQRSEKEQALRTLRERLQQWYGGNLDRIVRVKLTTNGTGEVALTVFSPYAGWSPFYRASLDSDEQTLSLATFVSVRQQTGLDWEGSINSHTAAPTDAVSLPTITPLVARIQEPPPPPSAQRRDVLSSQVFEVEADAKAFMPDMVQIEGEAGITFVGVGHVPSDNRPALLSVQDETVAAEIHPTLVPYQAERAWLMVETEQPMRSLLSGNAEFTVDGRFSGRSMLAHAGGGEPLSIAFGHSPLITAERTPVVYTERRTWLGRQVLRDGYHIEVKNGTAREATITVKDRLPVPGHDQIKLSSDIEPSPDENEDGVLTWRITLGAGESTTITVEYEIEYPNNMELLID